MAEMGANHPPQHVHGEYSCQCVWRVVRSVPANCAEDSVMGYDKKYQTGVDAYCRGMDGKLILFNVIVDDCSKDQLTEALEAVEQHLLDTKTEFYAPILLVIDGGRR